MRTLISRSMRSQALIGSGRNGLVGYVMPIHGEEAGALARLNTALHLQSLYHLPSGGL